MSIIKDRGSDRIFNCVNNAILILILIIVAYPLMYVLSASISSPDLVITGEMWLFPKGIQFDGYRRVFQDNSIWNGYKNTIIYTVSGTALSIFMTLATAYPLSRKDFVGRKLFTLIFTFTMFFNGGLIPTYLLIKDLGMRNTVWVMIILGSISMYYIIIARTFFQSNIPIELQESSYIDGCSNTRLFFSVVVPLSAPIIAVMLLFYGVIRWNEYFNAMIYLSDKKMFPLQLILREILVQNQMSFEMMMTDEHIEILDRQAKIAQLVKYVVIIVSSVPLLAAYPFLQRYFVEGMMVGAIKG